MVIQGVTIIMKKVLDGCICFKGMLYDKGQNITIQIARSPEGEKVVRYKVKIIPSSIN